MAAPKGGTEAPAVRPSVYSCVDVWRIPSGPETSHNALRGIGAEHGIAAEVPESDANGAVNVSQAANCTQIGEITETDRFILWFRTSRKFNLRLKLRFGLSFRRGGRWAGCGTQDTTPQKVFFSVTASRIFPTLNVTADLQTLFCYRKKFIAHPAATLRATRR